MPEDSSTLQLKLAEALVQDYRNLVSETRRKYIPIKDAAEKQVSWIRSQINSNEDIKKALINHNRLLLEPFLNGCLTKQQKIVIISLTAIQKLINNDCLSEEGANSVVGILWNLMNSNIEEVRVLQTTILLLTASSLVKDSLLAKAFTLCLRLHTSKTPATVNTAAAAVRQCASAIFDRILKEELHVVDEVSGIQVEKSLRPEDVRSVNVAELRPAEKDAYRLFQDICALLSDEPLTWLTEITEFSRALGLELIESLLLHYSVLFRESIPFAHLLKANLCPLVIKLFSPSLKLRSTPTGSSHDATSSAASGTAGGSHTGGTGTAGTALLPSTTNPVPVADKVSFPILVRLKRLITVIVEQYFHLLNTECEIYLSLLVRFLDVEKIAWERALALEVLLKFAMQPELIRYVCLSYDMRPHSTKIFQEWISTLSQYVQMVLASPSVGDELAKETIPPSGGTHQSGPNQSLLYYKGVFFPVVHPKSMLLDLLDRGEPPVLADGYCLSMAINCFVQIVQSLEMIVRDPKPITHVEGSEETPNAAEVNEQLLSLSWGGCLSAIALVLEASADEKVTANMLEALHTMIGLTGHLGADMARDAFVITMCKACLPSSYARSLFSAPTKGSSNNNTQVSLMHEEAFERSPVVLVVTQGVGHSINVTPTGASVTGSGVPGPGASSGGASHAGSSSLNDPSHTFPSGSLLITAKHLQAAKAVLYAAQVHGNVLGNSWNVMLTTLQNLVWMLGLKVEPTAQLYFKSTPNSGAAVTASEVTVGTAATSTVGSAASGTTTATTTTSTVPGANQSRAPLSSSLSSSSSAASVTADLATLSTMLSALFTKSNQLDVNALNDLVLGLTQLSSEAMEAASVNKEPSQFPIAKLTEVGLVNIDRLQLWWDSVCCQLLSMCKLSHTGLRQLAANALVLLIKQAMAAPQQPPFWKTESLTVTVLDPLSALSEVAYDDVREKQLDCVQHMLHCWGEQIGASWLRVIEIVGVIRDSYKVDLILTAFQCFKLIVTDYLSSLSPECYAACVVTAARFGHQKQDLNIALTAIGQILHLADYLLAKDQLSSTKPDAKVLSLEQLWISIFSHLAQLCLDRRPAIRKSACQTLFNTVECHGSRFDANTWSDMFWKVLFPLLENVHQLFLNAPVEREGRPNSLLVHHSRDTAAKQWAETVVLTLAGVSQLIASTKQDQLLVLPEFPKVWSTLLEHVRRHALTSSAEISVTALTSLQTLLNLKSTEPRINSMLWSGAWETWLQIGISAVHFESIPDAQSTASGAADKSSDLPDSGSAATASLPFLPTAAFMTLLFDLFIPLFSRAMDCSTAILVANDLHRLTEIFRLGLLAPLYVAHLFPQTAINQLPMIDDGTLSALQESVLRDLDFLIQTARIENGPLRVHLPTLLQLLLDLAGYAVHVPKPVGQPGSTAPGSRLEAVPLNYIVFAEKCLQTATDTYMATTNWANLCHGELFQAVVKTLHKPMALKYACPSQSTWVLACKCLLQVIPTANSVLAPVSSPAKRNVAKDTAKEENSVCTEIADTLQDFLFYQHQPPSSLSIEEFQQHEELDCKFVHVISDLFLSSSTELPQPFINRLVNLLSWGSVQASVPTFQGADSGCMSGDADSLFSMDHNASVLPKPNHTGSHRRPSSGSSTKPLPAKGLGMAVRQTETLAPPDPLTDGALSLDVDLDRLRQFAFRENFARLCFSTLLCHAFSRGASSTAENSQTATGDDTTTTAMSTKTVSVAVSRCAVRGILQRCRLTLIQFYQAACLTGKCPLPRARLAEIAYVFKALTAMLTSLRSVCAQRDVDPSTWQHVIELYPHIVDCVLVVGGSQMTVALHRLLRLYGDLLRPACLDSTTKTAPPNLMNGV